MPTFDPTYTNPVPVKVASPAVLACNTICKYLDDLDSVYDPSVRMFRDVRWYPGTATRFEWEHTNLRAPFALLAADRIMVLHSDSVPGLTRARMHFDLGIMATSEMGLPGHAAAMQISALLLDKLGDYGFQFNEPNFFLSGAEIAGATNMWIKHDRDSNTSLWLIEFGITIPLTPITEGTDLWPVLERNQNDYMLQGDDQIWSSYHETP